MRRVRVGDILVLKRRPIQIDPLAEYVSIGVRSFGNGIFHYDPMPGQQLSKLRYFCIEPGELVVSNIKGWEGAIAVSSDPERGCIASNRFLTYEARDATEVDLNFLRYYFLSEQGLPLIQKASPGSADRNRTLAIDRFENLEIPLPDYDEQCRIACHLDGSTARASQLADISAARSPERIVAVWPGIVAEAMGRLSERAAVGALFDFVNDVVRPGDSAAPAEAFVGLQHVESHTGRCLGQDGLGDEMGRKFRFAPGDVLYGYLRPYLNKVWVADRHGLCSVDQYVLRAKPGVSPAFLAHALRSRAVLSEAETLTHSLQLPRLRSGLLERIVVPYGPESAQLTIVDDLNVRLQKLVQTVDLARIQSRRVSALRSSILNHAFAGLTR